MKKVTDKDKTRKIYQVEVVLSYQVGNLQGIGSRDHQEDSFALINALDVNNILQNGLYAIVADGMGGMKDGKQVSENAVAEFVEAFQGLDRDADIPRQLADNVHLINSRLHQRFQGDGGTTVVSVMIYNGMAYWCSVGDSTIYLKRNGGLYRLNEEHTYRNKLYMEGLGKESINKLEVEGNEDCPRLSEFLGNVRIETIDYNRKPLRLLKDDVILLCSDGISGVLEEETILDALAYPPEAACEQLKRDIEKKCHRNQDNYTALVISCVS